MTLEDIELQLSQNLRILSDMFSVVAVDEAHRVKNDRALQIQAVWQLTDCSYLLITATPAKTSIQDWFGIARFLGKNSNPLVKAANIEDPHFASFKSLMKTFDDKYQSNILGVPDDMQLQYLAALDWTNLNKLGGSGRSNIEVAAYIVPLLAAMAMLRRAKGSLIEVLGRNIVIGAEIPPWTSRWIELVPGAIEAGYYRGVMENTEHMKMDTTSIGKDNVEAHVRKRLLWLVRLPCVFSVVSRFLYRLPDAKGYLQYVSIAEVR